MTTTIEPSGTAAFPEAAGPTGATRPRGRRQLPGAGIGMPAGRALQIMIGALVTAMIFNSAAMVRAGEGMQPGLTRTLVLAVGRPVNTVTHAVWLDRPQRVLAWAVGSDRSASGTSPLLAGGGTAAGPEPAPGGSPAAAGSPHRAADGPVPASRSVTAAEPLRLLVTGDSMTEFLGPALIKAAFPGGKVAGRTVTRYGTGLVRPDFFDWSREAERLISAESPEAVVVAMGGNDGQGMRLPTGEVLLDGSPEWATEYQRRAGIVLRAFTAGGVRRVYWVSMPVPRSARLAKDYAVLNRAVSAAAAAVPGARFVDVAPRLSVDGRYAAYVPDDAGHTVLARARDGIHLSRNGARIAAAIVLSTIDADWHVRGR